MDTLVSYLPIVRVLVIVSLLTAAVYYLFRARFTHRKWLMILARVTGGVLLLPTFFAFLAVVFELGCSSRPRILRSPDSKYVAEYRYDAGFLGRDVSAVAIRKEWSIYPETVYEYAGPSNWEATEVRWLANDELMIRYRADPQRMQYCKTQGAGIKVQCVPMTH